MSESPVAAYRIEVLTLPVADADRALRFYTEQAGFTLDVDYRPDPGFRVVQVTPPGSAASVQFGVGLTDAEPGTSRATYLVVPDIEAAHRELTARDVPTGPIRHKAPVDDWRGDLAPGPAPDRRDYASLFTFADPDGNTWTVQERGFGQAVSSTETRPG
ncbi:VOC family protein [Amycolatopsis jiangsuensis]|uniref:Catechol 2,3-dioxygenase-like lactoylglutathione lyase family enzyme n=1 Tax=Amycolatopsis jiangsuensis TaxID=1181879 RepID=A0A840J0X4_9PSEU|nr:VOC family protein [Amycolatopsis jiangsuensis]MBB4686844.1 catechol 2,3-dioxygenase-like lactoylglutathione lyase family enzyme [Amycolatopsis jiangsuensis]